MKTASIGINQYVVTAVRIILLLLFAYTGTFKLLDQDLFVFQMRLAPLPYMMTLAPVLAWLVPVTEIVLTGVLLTEHYYRFGIYGSVILLCIFEVYIAGMMLSGSHLPCSCGGIIATLSWKAHLLVNGFLIAMGILALRYDQRLQLQTR